jgi:RNA polymerase sigma-70 factor (ECF subfamily)
MGTVADDDDIRAALRGGLDDLAFRLLYERYGNVLYGRALLILHDDGQAEDAVQTTMIKLLRSRDRVEGIRDLHSWLLTVTTNNALDTLRRDRREKVRIERMREIDGAEDASGSRPEGESTGAPALHACLGQLDSATRAAVLRRHKDGASWDEIAHEMGLAADAARMRVRRAMQALKRCLNRKEVKP